jgi:hypothetical protein
MMEEVSDLLSEKVLPDVNGGHGDNHDITQRNEGEKHSLLETSYSSKIHDIETTVGHGTGTEKEGVDVTQIELVLGIARVAIGGAAIYDDGG